MQTRMSPTEQGDPTEDGIPDTLAEQSDMLGSYKQNLPWRSRTQVIASTARPQPPDRRTKREERDKTLHSRQYEGCQRHAKHFAGPALGVVEEVLPHNSQTRLALRSYSWPPWPMSQPFRSTAHLCDSSHESYQHLQQHFHSHNAIDA